MLDFQFNSVIVIAACIEIKITEKKTYLLSQGFALKPFKQNSIFWSAFTKPSWGIKARVSCKKKYARN